MGLFAKENAVKDGWFANKPDKDDWPRARFREANEAANGEWYEYNFDLADLSRVFVQWNEELALPKTGVMITDALELPKVKEWLASGKPQKLNRESHLWLSSKYIRHDSSEEMTPRDGVFYLLDGLHRSIHWFSEKREPVSVFIAGKTT